MQAGNEDWRSLRHADPSGAVYPLGFDDPSSLQSQSSTVLMPAASLNTEKSLDEAAVHSLTVSTSGTTKLCSFQLNTQHYCAMKCKVGAIIYVRVSLPSHAATSLRQALSAGLGEAEHGYVNLADLHQPLPGKSLEHQDSDIEMCVNLPFNSTQHCDLTATFPYCHHQVAHPPGS